MWNGRQREITRDRLWMRLKRNKNNWKWFVWSRVSLSSRSCPKKFPRERDESISLVGESRRRKETALFWLRNGEEMREKRVPERDGDSDGCLFSTRCALSPIYSGKICVIWRDEKRQNGDYRAFKFIVVHFTLNLTLRWTFWTKVNW